jgi:hypothetical protein
LPDSAVVRLVTHQPPNEDDPKQRASCLYGALVSRGNQLACDVGASACGSGERYVKAAPDAGQADVAGKCEATPPCAVGEIFGETTKQCEKIVRGKIVDVGTWARLAIGVDGAEGTAGFCSPVRATQARGAFQIQISIPDNDVTQAVLKLTAKPQTPPQSADAAVKSLERLAKMLRFYAGTASAAAVTLDVFCTPNQPGRPALDLAPQDSLDAGR